MLRPCLRAPGAALRCQLPPALQPQRPRQAPCRPSRRQSIRELLATPVVPCFRSPWGKPSRDRGEQCACSLAARMQARKLSLPCRSAAAATVVLAGAGATFALRCTPAPCPANAHRRRRPHAAGHDDRPGVVVQAWWNPWVRAWLLAHRGRVRAPPRPRTLPSHAALLLALAAAARASRRCLPPGAGDRTAQHIRRSPGRLARRAAWCGPQQQPCVVLNAGPPRRRPSAALARPPAQAPSWWCGRCRSSGAASSANCSPTPLWTRRSSGRTGAPGWGGGGWRSVRVPGLVS